MKKLNQNLKVLRSTAIISLITLSISLALIIIGAIFSLKIITILAISVFLLSSYLLPFSCLCYYDRAFMGKVVYCIEKDQILTARRIAKTLSTNPEAVCSAVKSAKKTGLLKNYEFDGEKLSLNPSIKPEKVIVSCSHCSAILKVGKTTKKCSYCNSPLDIIKNPDEFEAKFEKEKELFKEQCKYSTSMFAVSGTELGSKNIATKAEPEIVDTKNNDKKPSSKTKKTSSKTTLQVKNPKTKTSATKKPQTLKKPKTSYKSQTKQVSTPAKKAASTPTTKPKK